MKKIISIISALAILAAMTSCGSKSSDSGKEKNEGYNNFFFSTNPDGVIYHGTDGFAYTFDYSTNESALLCNLPNCTHTTSECLANNLKVQLHLPIIYEGNAYYFVNMTGNKDVDGKNLLDLKTYMMKYDFSKSEVSNVAKITDFNYDINSGGYLIGSDYYVIMVIGNPKYDESGNVTSSSSGGGGNLFRINFDSGEYADLGEVFDYEELKRTNPNAACSTSMDIAGKCGDKLYIGITYSEADLSYESAIFSGWAGEVYSFDLITKEFEKVTDNRTSCVNNGYITYFKSNEDQTIVIQNAESGEITEGPVAKNTNTISVFDDRLWHDAMCYDIASGKDVKISDMEGLSETFSLYY